ncbi:MAG: hypothetical protein EZS28_020932 [Streblomastix strix]|uniref:Uncharacterized protein n=1 Tax=Streblomastix strix TaxID=222440 RepID=A0A5J4VM53_9EUKA|nr:MAG: hypothetical protein EZS28_020932 [Streblomastix strix]
MNQAQAFKNLMENGTSIEYFNNGYIMQVKDKIKVYEEGKKSARTLTSAQQTKLLLEARGGGQGKPKHAAKRQVATERSSTTFQVAAQARRQIGDFESDFDDINDETSLNDRKFIQEEQLMNDFDDDDDQVIVEKPVKTSKPTTYSRKDQADSSAQKTIKKPQINYTSPQVDLEELIRLPTCDLPGCQIPFGKVVELRSVCNFVADEFHVVYNIFYPHNTGAPIRFYLQHTLENPYPPIPCSLIPYNQFETVMISI